MNMGEEGKERWKSNKLHVQRWEKAKENMAGGWIFQIRPVRRVAHVTDNATRACDALSTGEFVATTLHLS